MRNILFLSSVLIIVIAAFAISPLPPCIPWVVVYGQQIVAPFQPIAELIGASLTENLRTGEISITYRGHTFRCTPGMTIAHQDAQEITLPLAAYCHGNVLYAPLAPLAEALGGTVRSDVTTHQVIFTLPGAATLAMPSKDQNDPPGLAIDHAVELYEVNLNGTCYHRLTYDGNGTILPTVSHDGTKLLWESGDKLHLRALNNSQEHQLGMDQPTPSLQYHTPFFSADDRRVFYDYSDATHEKYVQQVRSMALDGTDVRTIAEGVYLTVSPDGRWVTYQIQPPGNADMQLWLASLDGKPPRALGVNQSIPIFSPDSRHLVWKIEWQQGDHYMSALMLATITDGGIERRQLMQLADYDCELHPGCFSADSQRLVCRDRGLAIYELATGKRTPVLESTDITMPSFTPDGTRIVFLSQRHLCVIKPDGSEFRILTPSIQLFNGIRWSYTYAPDERIIFAASPE